MSRVYASSVALAKSPVTVSDGNKAHCRPREDRCAYQRSCIHYESLPPPPPETKMPALLPIGVASRLAALCRKPEVRSILDRGRRCDIDHRRKRRPNFRMLDQGATGSAVIRVAAGSLQIKGTIGLVGYGAGHEGGGFALTCRARRHYVDPQRHIHVAESMIRKLSGTTRPDLFKRSVRSVGAKAKGVTG